MSQRALGRQFDEADAGHCYPLAIKYLHAHPDATLVHGATHGGLIKHHAWVEDGENVYEPTYNMVLSKQSHEQGFRPQPQARYTAEEAMINSLKAGHAGPWHE